MGSKLGVGNSALAAKFTTENPGPVTVLVIPLWDPPPFLAASAKFPTAKLTRHRPPPPAVLKEGAKSDRKVISIPEISSPATHQRENLIFMDSQTRELPNSTVPKLQKQHLALF